MRKLNLITILTLLTVTIVVAISVFASQSSDYSGSGGAMGEYEGRLDGKSQSKSEIASAASRPRNDGGLAHNDGSEGAQYRGGSGSGGAMGEWEGRLDGGKGQSKNNQKK
jgi:hypothetical protein